MNNMIADYLLADFGSFVEKCAAAGVDAYEFVGKVAQAAVESSGLVPTTESKASKIAATVKEMLAKLGRG